MGEIRRLEREEAQRQRFDTRLAQLDVSLTPDQQTAVYGATQKFQEKRRQMFRDVRRSVGADLRTEEGRQKLRDEMQQAGDTLKEGYSTTIYSLVPTAEAEKIVNGMANSGGGRNRRFNARGFGGGGRARGGN